MAIVAGLLGGTYPEPPPVNWRALNPRDTLADPSILNRPTHDQYIATLYNWGTLQFRVLPLNVHEIEHETSTDWAHKEILGAAIYREWTGENDETLFFRGQLFPYRIGGMADLEIFEALRRKGIANVLISGQGEYMGWYVCEKLVRSHQHLSSEGVGQQLQFEAVFARVPIPPADEYYSELWGTAL